MSESRGISWQRANIERAATYLRERIAAGATDVRTKVVYEGLLDVLDPARRTLRQQRALAQVAQAAVPVDATRDRRRGTERRGSGDRRQVNLGPQDGVERRSGINRRSNRERRNREG